MSLENFPQNSNERVLEIMKVLPMQAQLELVQLMNGLRPVAEVTIIPPKREKMLPVIEELKQRFAIDNNEQDEILREFISENPLLAEEAASLANKDALNKEEQKRFGELMGFPETAIQTYVQDKPLGLTYDEMNKEVTRCLGFENKLFHLRLSLPPTAEEIDYLRKSYKAVLEQTPYLLEQYEVLSPEEVEGYKQKVSQFVYGS